MASNPLISQQGAKNLCAICDRCMLTKTEESKILSEISRFKKRSVEDLVRQMKYDMPELREKVSKWTKERLERKRKRLEEYEARLKQQEEELSYDIMDRILQGEEVDEAVEIIAGDEIRKELEQQIRELSYQTEGASGQDLERCLKDYVEQGYLDWEGAKIKITSKGARKLAGNVLSRILEKLAPIEVGPHNLQETGYGSEPSTYSRKYELGDEYHRIDFEKTFLNALERNSGRRKISLKPEYFQIYDELHQTKICAGLIIDESGSMAGDKINAAIDTALALTELIRREPQDLLKVYLFSSQVREIPYYDILNASFSNGITDTRAALIAFRKGASSEKGDKQAYLITDTEPNTENGRYVGFKEATLGLIQEALYYRQAGITLNIIMLAQSPHLKELASVLAKKNLGRVFFTSTLKLGEVVIEDYLTSKKKNCLGF